MDHITTEEFAEIARTSPATIRYWRYVGTGPTGFKLGRRVLYARQDVLDWIESQRVEQSGPAHSTSATRR